MQEFLSCIEIMSKLPLIIPTENLLDCNCLLREIFDVHRFHISILSSLEFMSSQKSSKLCLNFNNRCLQSSKTLQTSEHFVERLYFQRSIIVIAPIFLHLSHLKIILLFKEELFLCFFFSNYQRICRHVSVSLCLSL